MSGPSLSRGIALQPAPRGEWETWESAALGITDSSVNLFEFRDDHLVFGFGDHGEYTSHVSRNSRKQAASEISLTPVGSENGGAGGACSLEQTASAEASRESSPRRLWSLSTFSSSGRSMAASETGPSPPSDAVSQTTAPTTGAPGSMAPTLRDNRGVQGAMTGHPAQTRTEAQVLGEWIESFEAFERSGPLWRPQADRALYRAASEARISPRQGSLAASLHAAPPGIQLSPRDMQPRRAAAAAAEGELKSLGNSAGLGALHSSTSSKFAGADDLLEADKLCRVAAQRLHTLTPGRRPPRTAGRAPVGHLSARKAEEALGSGGSDTSSRVTGADSRMGATRPDAGIQHTERTRRALHLRSPSMGAPLGAALGVSECQAEEGAPCAAMGTPPLGGWRPQDFFSSWKNLEERNHGQDDRWHAGHGLPRLARYGSVESTELVALPSESTHCKGLDVSAQTRLRDGRRRMPRTVSMVDRLEDVSSGDSDSGGNSGVLSERSKFRSPPPRTPPQEMEGRSFGGQNAGGESDNAAAHAGAHPRGLAANGAQAAAMSSSPNNATHDWCANNPPSKKPDCATAPHASDWRASDIPSADLRQSASARRACSLACPGAAAKTERPRVLRAHPVLKLDLDAIEAEGEAIEQAAPPPATASPRLGMRKVPTPKWKHGSISPEATTGPSPRRPKTPKSARKGPLPSLSSFKHPTKSASSARSRSSSRSVSSRRSIGTGGSPKENGRGKAIERSLESTPKMEGPKKASDRNVQLRGLSPRTPKQLTPKSPRKKVPAEKRVAESLGASHSPTGFFMPRSAISQVWAAITKPAPMRKRADEGPSSLARGRSLGGEKGKRLLPEFGQWEDTGTGGMEGFTGEFNHLQRQREAELWA